MHSDEFMALERSIDGVFKCLLDISRIMDRHERAIVDITNAHNALADDHLKLLGDLKEKNEAL
jgi:hypothetical protein